MKEFKATVQRLRDPVTKQWRNKQVLVVRKRKGKRKVDWDKLTETAA